MFKNIESQFYIKSNYYKYDYNFSVMDNQLISSENSLMNIENIRFKVGTKIIKGPQSK